MTICLYHTGMGSEKINEHQVTNFPLSDLINGYIYYNQADHMNKEPAKDVFFFSVTDGINVSPILSLNISIQVLFY